MMTGKHHDTRLTGRIRIIYDSDGEESGSYLTVTGKNQDHI